MSGSAALASAPDAALKERPAGLHALFAPRGIAVLGASGEAQRTGGRVLDVLAMTGYAGAIHPVNPRQQAIGSLTCYSRVEDVPDPVDLAIICLAAARVPDAIRDCARRGIAAAIVFADGFSDPSLGAALRAALAEARALSGLRMIGPNTVGVRCVNRRVYATFATDVGTGGLPGTIATIGQSGGLTVYFGSAYIERLGLGSKYVIDTGAEFDIDAADALDYVADDPEITCAALILEGCPNGARLLRAVDRMIARGKPVVLWKIGRSRAGLEQVASHTGALAGHSSLFETALRRRGAIVADNETELVDAVTLAAMGRIPRGRRLGVVTPSGGYAIATLDAAERFGMEMPQPEQPPTEAQRAALGAAELRNPLDYSGAISSALAAERAALHWMAAQPNLDAILLWQAYGNLHAARRTHLEATLRELQTLSSTPVFGCGVTTPDFAQCLRSLGVPWFEEPTRLVRALALVAPQVEASAPRTEAITAARQSVVSGAVARAALAGVTELPHVATIEVASEADVRRQHERWGGKLFLKLECGDIPHKTELGLVRGPLGPGETASAFAELAIRQAEYPGTTIVLQPAVDGAELAFGVRRDPVFGPTVMVATGGIFLEVFGDAAFAPAPIMVAEAKQMIIGLKGAPLLFGARGKPLADVDAAAEALSALSRYATAHAGEYREIDINPVIVRKRGQGVVAVDAMLVRGSGE